ncbi:MAG: peptidoglycan DD-metalloendopeptidase family protein [Eubacteriales bacterium]
MKKKLFRESDLKERVMKLLNKEGFYVAIFLCITLIATAVVYFTNNSMNRDLAQNESGEISESIDIQEDAADVSKIIDEIEDDDMDEKQEEAPEEQINIENKTNESNPSSEIKTPDPLDNLVNPVGSKEVVMAFSFGTQPVYSATLKEFRSDHTGIDLKAELGQEVKAAFDGKVIKIYNDGKLGKTIVIQHASNVETRYSNLDENISVTLNQTVKAGQGIAKVGKTAAFEIDDEPHLHFEVWKDGKCIDPQPYLQ